jgi:hypothetical protein
MKRSAKLIAILRVAPYRAALLRYGVAAAVEHREALGSLDPRTVVDVGANRGQFSLFALHAFPNARIISFEPLDAPATRFRPLFANGPRVTFHNAALAPESGQSTMHVGASFILPRRSQTSGGPDGLRTHCIGALEEPSLRRGYRHGGAKKEFYFSVSGVDGTTSEVTGTFFVPTNTGCGPSAQPDLRGYAPSVGALLSAGVRHRADRLSGPPSVPRTADCRLQCHRRRSRVAKYFSGRIVEVAGLRRIAGRSGGMGR